MNKGNKRIKHLTPILEKYDNIETITELFNQKLPDLYPKETTEKYGFEKDLEDKKNKILDKYMTEAIVKEQNRRHRERFNF